MLTADAVGLRNFAEAVFLKAKLTPPDAALAADVLIEADLRGVHSHGLQELPTWGRGFLRGELATSPACPVVVDAGSLAVIDAGGGLGAIACNRAMDLAIQRARDAGVAYVGVRSSSHFGMAGYFTMKALEHDQIGFCTTNGPAVMAPWGGKQPMLCNNPFSYSIPSGDEPPIVLDMACSAVARGRVRAMARDGLSIPDGWAIDRNGQPTTDSRKAMEGAVLPFGGYKGYGIAVINEILSSALVGALFSFEVARGIVRNAEAELQDKTQKAWMCGHLVGALDIGRIVPINEFKRRVDELIRVVRGSALASGAERIYLPGEIEHETRRERLVTGIPLPESTVELLRAFVSRDLGGSPNPDSFVRFTPVGVL